VRDAEEKKIECESQLDDIVSSTGRQTRHSYGFHPSIAQVETLKLSKDVSKLMRLAEKSASMN